MEGDASSQQTNNFYAVTAEQVKPFIKDVSGLPISELKAKVRGQVYLRGDHSFPICAKLFNGAMQSPACIIVCPLDAKDISETILFCKAHNLSPSVKSGGYGTHGLSVEGDVIIDMNNLQDISISTENIPMPGSTAAMDMSPEQQDVGLRRYPNSTVDPYAPPELLKRRREEAFGSDDDEEGDGQASTQVSPSTRPSISSTTAGSSHPLSAAMSRVRSSASGSGSGSGSSADGPAPPTNAEEGDDKEPSARRIRPRLGSPDALPSIEEALLAGSVPMRRPPPTGPVAEDYDRGGASGTPSVLSAMTSPPDSAGISTSTPASSGGEGENVGERALVLQDTSVEEVRQVAAAPPAPRLQPAPAPTARPRGPFSYGMPSSTTSTSGAAASYVPPTACNPLGSDSGARSISTTAYSTHPIEPSVPFIYVSFGAGASQRQVDAYTTSHPVQGKTAVGTPIDVPYYVPLAAHPVGTTTMILGGFGFQTRLRGLSVDSLVEVEMVLPDGRIVVVNEEENQDLWWGVRGAGPAFGIATRYKAKAYPVPVVFAGNVIYEFHRATAASLIRHFRDCIKIAPRELYANVILTAGPRKNGALVVIQICWLGPKEGGLPFLNAILSWSGGQCLLNEVNEKTFAHQQDSVAKVLKAAAGRKWFLRSDVVTTLTDELIHQSAEKFAETPDGCAWLFELGGGAMVDFVEGTPIPKKMREGSFNIVAFHQWKVEDADEACVDSAEEWMREHVNKLSAGGPLPSFFERKELLSRTIGMYGTDNWDRLVQLKRKYDSNGLLRHTFWPLDVDGRPVGLDGGSKGKEKEKEEGQRFGNHFMDQFLRG